MMVCGLERRYLPWAVQVPGVPLGYYRGEACCRLGMWSLYLTRTGCQKELAVGCR